SREYNIALGERRAQAARDYLAAQGVAVNNIRVISYGEERPAAAGNTEDAYAQNRRAELSY
ncbi:OmpA family protein, partial [Psychrobacter sp. TB47]